MDTENTRGFSLLETLVALTIMTVALFGLVQLLSVSARSNQVAHSMTMATLLAQAKVEQLRALAWGFDAAGIAVSDRTTDVTIVPEQPSGGRGLSPSPPGTLEWNVEGYCDFLDSWGRQTGRGTTPPPGTAYVRRWSIELVPTRHENAVLLQVSVSPWIGSGNATLKGGRRPGEVRLVSVRTRRVT
jgi:prepilin-type N-terminal cleavage/methylation domain-containing protein